MTAQAMDNGRPLDNNDEAMTLTEHLGELRRRILHSLAALAAGTLVSSFYIDEIVAVLTAPATNLYYMRPAEAFFIYIKIALACGVLLAAPVLFYELWAFLVPALTGRERSALMLFVPSSVLLFWAGCISAGAALFYNLCRRQYCADAFDRKLSGLFPDAGCAFRLYF